MIHSLVILIFWIIKVLFKFNNFTDFPPNIEFTNKKINNDSEFS